MWQCCKEFIVLPSLVQCSFKLQFQIIIIYYNSGAKVKTHYSSLYISVYGNICRLLACVRQIFCPSVVQYIWSASCIVFFLNFFRKNVYINRRMISLPRGSGCKYECFQSQTDFNELKFLPVRDPHHKCRVQNSSVCVIFLLLIVFH